MVRLVTFAIIGAEKCGTTWLHYTLRQHRQIYMPLEETKYFSAALDEMGSYEDHFEAREFDAKLEARWYRDAPPEALALGDKSPSYFTHEHALARMRVYNPRMRVVVMLRDPVFATWSRQRMYRRMQCGCDDFDLASWMGSKRGPRLREQLQQAHFAEHLRRADASFPRSAIFVAILERVRDAPGALLPLYAFLGVDAVPLPRHRVPNAHPPALPASNETLCELATSFAPWNAELFERLGETVGEWLAPGDVCRRQQKLAAHAAELRGGP